jgi:hypothetical protein
MEMASRDMGAAKGAKNQALRKLCAYYLIRMF